MPISSRPVRLPGDNPASPQAGPPLVLAFVLSVLPAAAGTFLPASDGGIAPCGGDLAACGAP